MHENEGIARDRLATSGYAGTNVVSDQTASSKTGRPNRLYKGPKGPGNGKEVLLSKVKVYGIEQPSSSVEQIINKCR